MVYCDGDFEVDPVAAAAAETSVIAAEVRDWLMRECGMRERLDASVDPDAERAFWTGFRDGVRAYLVEMRIGSGSNCGPGRGVRVPSQNRYRVQ